MKLLIPICGEGTRLKSDVPKPLYPLEYDLPLIKASVVGFKEITQLDGIVVGLPINSNFNSTVLELIANEFPSVKVEPLYLGSSESQIETVVKMLGLISGDFSFIVHNCDTYVKFKSNVNFKESEIKYFCFNSNSVQLSKIWLKGNSIVKILERYDGEHAISSSGTYFFRSKIMITGNKKVVSNIEKGKLTNFSQLLSYLNERVDVEFLDNCYPLGSFQQIEENLTKFKKHYFG